MDYPFECAGPCAVVLVNSSPSTVSVGLDCSGFCFDAVPGVNGPFGLLSGSHYFSVAQVDVSSVSFSVLRDSGPPSTDFLFGAAGLICALLVAAVLLRS